MIFRVVCALVAVVSALFFIATAGKAWGGGDHNPQEWERLLDTLQALAVVFSGSLIAFAIADNKPKRDSEEPK